MQSIDLNQMPSNISSLAPNNIQTWTTSGFDLNQPPLDPNEVQGEQMNAEMVAARSSSHSNKKKNLTYEQKKGVIEMLLQESCNGKVTYGSETRIASLFSISLRSVQRLWREAKSLESGSIPDLSSKLNKRVGRKKVQVDFHKVKEIPLRCRGNIRSFSEAMGLSKSTLHRRIKAGYIWPHSNAIKPYLSDANKKQRIEFCLSMISGGTLNSLYYFNNMYDRIHIDEKWFYMSRSSQKYYLHPDELGPHRTCKSKQFISKIMFLVAVAHPRVDMISRMSFDGKIGIWPFVVKESAKRNSKNRIAGTMETKPILSVTKDVIRSCLIEKLLPAIKEKWPRFGSRKIFIQQDNAKPHLDVNDSLFNEAANFDDIEIQLCYQPPNSPDMNVLDLGFFRAIDSLQHREASTTIDELVSAVEKAYWEFPVEELNNVFLTLQTCMLEVMKVSGANNYKIPHMNKHKLLRNGHLPECISCDIEVIDQAKATLEQS